MNARVKFFVALVLFGILAIGRSATTALAATKIEDFDAKIIVAYSGNLDNTTQRKIFSAGKLKQGTWPILFSATRTKGNSFGSANLNAAFLYDGAYLGGAFYPSVLVQQFRPINNKPAVLAIDFDDFELEADGKAPLRGFFFNNFVLVGTVAPGGYVKIIVKLEIDAEGPGTNVSRRISLTRTFTSDFTASATDLFGPKGLFGVDLSNKKIEDLELSGIIRFDALGTANGTTTLEVETED
jgi:hypothetical protein